MRAIAQFLQRRRDIEAFELPARSVVGIGRRRTGSGGENWLLPGGDETRAERLPDKCTVELQAGDAVRMLTPGGGGWGEPAEGSYRAGWLEGGAGDVPLCEHQVGV